MDEYAVLCGPRGVQTFEDVEEAEEYYDECVKKFPNARVVLFKASWNVVRSQNNNI